MKLSLSLLPPQRGALLLTSAVLLSLRASWSQAAVTRSPNGLALTPQMGWNNWNSAGCDDLSQDLILDNAKKIVDLGLRDLGYNYVVMDDCWSDGRFDNGTLKPNMTRFPDGIGYLADQIHGMGLKWGMYSSAGKYTCAEYEGSLGHEKDDATTFAGWGVDYLKYDNCFNQGQEGTSKLSFDRYNAMAEALNATGRPIHYGMCSWGKDYPWAWANTIANSWRVSGDIYDSFDRPDPRCPCTTWQCELPGFHCSIMNILNKVAPIVDRGRPGGWNDLDSLEVGNKGMTDDEYMLHFTMWALVKSPLIMGNDLTLMDPKTLSILSNPAIIAINQDPAGMSALRVWERPANYLNNASDSAALYTAGETYFWTGQLQNGDQVVAFVNAATAATALSATLREIFIDKATTGSSKPVKALDQTYDVYDLWGHRMDQQTAQDIIDHGATFDSKVNATTNATIADVRYNSTDTSYADGLKANSTALLGKKVGVLKPGQTLDAHVPGHGVKAYRLRSQDGGGDMSKRDEL